MKISRGMCCGLVYAGQLDPRYAAGMHEDASTPIERLPNLGPKSARVLRSVGVSTVEDLSRIGPVAAYVRARHAWDGATLNLLWALVAGLRGMHWRELESAEKAALGAQVQAFSLEARSEPSS